MENQMYLTPSQVEELRDLGVEFKNTFIVNQLHLVNKDEEDYIWKCKVNNPTLDKKIKIIPAPSLQEVMKKVPKTIECDNHLADYFLRIEWDLDNETCCMFYDHENSYSNDVFTFGVENKNPLLAAFELIKEVSKYHPKSLTDKTE